MRHALAILVFSFATACALEPPAPDPVLELDHGQSVEPASCAAACRVGLDLCDSDADTRTVVEECDRSCPFSAAERECLSQISCGGDTSACY